MRLPSDEQEMRDYVRWLVRNRYQDALPILAASTSGFGSRLGLLERDLANARKLLGEFRGEQARSLHDPLRISRIGEDEKLHEFSQSLYYSVLECIARLQVMIELMLLYYGCLRIGVGRLPGVLTERGGVNYENEVGRIRRLRIRDVWADFKFPDVRGYVCSTSEKALLRRVLNRTAKTIRGYLLDLADFRRNFLAVHNKYKHTMVEIVDRYATVQRDAGIDCMPQFYVRSKERSPRKRQWRVYTYAVRSDERFLDYLESLIDKWATVTASLSDTHLQWLVNKGNAAFPRHIDVKPDEAPNVKAAIDGEPSFRHVVNFLGAFHITWMPKAVQRIERSLRRGYVARLALDIMDPRKLRKVRIARKSAQSSSS